MSKERARRREVREREAAHRAAERVAAAERDARRRTRRQALRRRFAPLLPGGPNGRPTGALARRRQLRFNMIVVGLFLVQVLVWIARPDWGARLAALVIALLAFPVLAAFVL